MTLHNTYKAIATVMQISCNGVDKEQRNAGVDMDHALMMMMAPILPGHIS